MACRSKDVQHLLQGRQVQEPVTGVVSSNEVFKHLESGYNQDTGSRALHLQSDYMC